MPPPHQPPPARSETVQSSPPLPPDPPAIASRETSRTAVPITVTPLRSNRIMPQPHHFTHLLQQLQLRVRDNSLASNRNRGHLHRTVQSAFAQPLTRVTRGIHLPMLINPCKLA